MDGPLAELKNVSKFIPVVRDVPNCLQAEADMSDLNLMRTLRLTHGRGRVKTPGDSPHSTATWQIDQSSMLQP
ncbi:hypothetical protein CALCODRAFT_495283 [Calocera cornea HHB12733]|uniref:Uncharacterized protein n=1 Tax=Calocera cornea HHB12733 TaxID=1353952 RepID=A0A165GKM1_9BASI|nr:hypothetical protein CALCODRAFT_495283 [Calocera cornea HHB12733]